MLCCIDFIFTAEFPSHSNCFLSGYDAPIFQMRRKRPKAGCLHKMTELEKCQVSRRSRPSDSGMRDCVDVIQIGLELEVLLPRAIPGRCYHTCHSSLGSRAGMLTYPKYSSLSLIASLPLSCEMEAPTMWQGLAMEKEIRNKSSLLIFNLKKLLYFPWVYQQHWTKATASVSLPEHWVPPQALLQVI